MNLFKKSTCTVLIITLIFFSFLPLNHSLAKTTSNDSMIILDSTSKKTLPDRFREIKSLNISGSSQFTPLELSNINHKINSPKLYIVDLRQESHGFINNTAISFYNPRLDLNNGFTASQTIAYENKMLSSVSLDKNTTIYSKTTKPLYNILVKSVSNEANIVKHVNLPYVRLSVKDGAIPTPDTANQFVAMVKHQVENSHIHFHCDEGDIRTTIFLSMYQMMKNNKALTFEEILKYQYSIGGTDFTDNRDALEFLHGFYKYTQENKKNNFRVVYSNWIKCPTSKYTETTQ